MSNYQDLKDSAGRVIGRLEQSGAITFIKNSAGVVLGRFDGKQTFDSAGRVVGTGNLLTMLLGKKK
jgi:hypothetical protein